MCPSNSSVPPLRFQPQYLHLAAPASAPSTNLVNPPPTTTDESLALIDPIFASATPPPPGLPAPAPLHASYVSPEPFPPPPSAPPTTPPASFRAHSIAIYSPLSPSPPNQQVSPLMPRRNLSAPCSSQRTAPADSHARRDLRSTRYAALSHEQRRVFVALIQSHNGDVDHGDDPHRVGPTRRSKTDLS